MTSKAPPEASLAAPFEQRRDALREEFREHKLALLPGFLSGRALASVVQAVDAGTFDERELDTAIKTEQIMRPNDASALLLFLLNDPRLFALVEEVTGCAQIGLFSGRTYRMLPDAGHRGEWHDDLVGERRAALSINLSREPFEGGALEIRDSVAGRVLRRVGEPQALGDAVLIGIEPGIEHRVTELRGGAPKTAHVGFFRGGPRSPLAGARESRTVGAVA